MGFELYEKWEAAEGIEAPVARALVNENHEGLSVTMLFSEIIGGLGKDLRMDFGRVPAYAVHEEFVHPWNVSDVGTLPKLGGEWGDYSFPLLTVKNSRWLGSFSESQLASHQNCIHYRLVTLDQTVDVLCNRAVKVSWVTPQQAD